MSEDDRATSNSKRVEGERAFNAARERDASRGNADLPGIDFSTFVLSLSHSALVHLGDAPAPDGGKLPINLAMARQTIDLLALLQEKTKNNLTGAEEHMMDQVLYDLRMRYVEVAKAQ